MSHESTEGPVTAINCDKTSQFPPKNGVPVDSYDACNLPLCTEESYAHDLAHVLAAGSKAEAGWHSKACGIKGESILNRFPGIY
jgi:hypothetical protein